MSQMPSDNLSVPIPQNKLGKVGLILAIVGFFTCGVVAPIAFVVCLIAVFNEPKKNATIGLILSGLSIVLLPILGIMVAIAVPSFVRAREISRKNACQANLVQIDVAKTRWATDTSAEDDATPTWEDLVPKYLPSEPVCPGGGSYEIGTVGEDPWCSLETQQHFPHVYRTQ